MLGAQSLGWRELDLADARALVGLAQIGWTSETEDADYRRVTLQQCVDGLRRRMRDERYWSDAERGDLLREVAQDVNDSFVHAGMSGRDQSPAHDLARSDVACNGFGERTADVYPYAYGHNTRSCVCSLSSLPAGFSSGPRDDLRSRFITKTQIAPST